MSYGEYPAKRDLSAMRKHGGSYAWRVGLFWQDTIDIWWHHNSTWHVYKSDFDFTNCTQQFAFTGYCEYLGENWLCYNWISLYLNGHLCYKTPHISSLWVSYGAAIVSLLVISHFLKPSQFGIMYHIMTSSNGNIFWVTGHLCGEFTSRWWIPRTKANDVELWCFLWSTPE